jgi:predicted aminopeptidase
MKLKRPTSRARRSLVATLFIVAAAAFTGCQTVGYYAQAVRGQCQMLAHERSCEKLLADPRTTAELMTKLQLAGEICDFAKRELNLPVNGHYRHYADLQRPYAVWNVYAAPEFSLASKTWWYPIVGSLEYRGFFAERDARKFAARLGGQGFDVYVEGVEAYSTLGWFKDPLLNTFIHHDEAALAEILFHELAHQRVFASGDTDFNEAFATAVGEEGVRRWLRTKGDTATLERYLASLRRNMEFVQVVTATRNKLQLLYGDERLAGGEKVNAAKKSGEISSDELHREKQRILEELRRNYEKLKGDWGGYTGYDEWFAHGVNNAQLNSIATYYDLVPTFERLLEANDGDLEKFYAAAKKLAKLPSADRQRRLNRGLISSRTSATPS